MLHITDWIQTDLVLLEDVVGNGLLMNIHEQARSAIALARPASMCAPRDNHEIMR